jgi:hypothetical protein
MISPNLKLETEKVLLRPVQQLDIAAFAPLAKDESIFKYFTFLLNDPGELQRWIESYRRYMREHQFRKHFLL